MLLSKPFRLVVAAISASQVAQAQDWCFGNPSITGYCDTITIVNTTTSSSPLLSDCQLTCRGIVSDAGDWSADFTGTPPNFRNNMIGGPCGFSLTRGNGDPNESFLMNNQDIIDIFEAVISQFASNGRASGQGTFSCQGKLANWFIT